MLSGFLTLLYQTLVSFANQELGNSGSILLKLICNAIKKFNVGLPCFDMHLLLVISQLRINILMRCRRQIGCLQYCSLQRFWYWFKMWIYVSTLSCTFLLEFCIAFEFRCLKLIFTEIYWSIQRLEKYWLVDSVWNESAICSVHGDVHIVLTFAS